MGRKVVSTVGAAALALLAACGATRSSLVLENSDARLGRVKTVGVVVVETDVHDIGATGGTALNEAKSARSRSCFEAAATASLAKHGLEARLIPENPEVRALAAAFQEARGPMMKKRHFPGNAGRMEGLAPLPGAARVVRAHGVDGLVLLSAIDHQSSTGSILTATFLPFLGGATRGFAYATAALVDADGTIIVYSQSSDTKGPALVMTKDEDVAEVCDALAAGFTRPGP